MSPIPPVRSWVPGAVLLGAAAVAAGLAALALGIRSWAPYFGLVALVVLAMGWLERIWMARTVAAPPRSRGKLKVIRGGKSEYDLAKDDSTNNQRYLM
jgi:hypothetical protein